jgi:hypothetical protein
MTGLSAAPCNAGWLSKPHLGMLVTLRRCAARIAMARVQAASSRWALYVRTQGVDGPRWLAAKHSSSAPLARKST